jgi:ABC-2 type transport system permease protein
MNTESNAVPEAALDSQVIAPAATAGTRPVYWSVRRELWENRSIYIGPLAIAAVAMLGFLISLLGLPCTVRELTGLSPMGQHIVLAMPYTHVSMLIILTAFLVGFFYSLEALHGERRDRSILFWKSLPVSDLTTVLAKASVPLVILPLLVMAVVLVLHLSMLLLGLAVVSLSGADAATMWAKLPFFQLEAGLLYGVVVMTLWHAPLYGWLLLVSGWARRATFLWAVLPLVAIAVFERIAFHSAHLGVLLANRMYGFAAEAFNLTLPGGTPVDGHFIPVTQFTPLKFLSSPGLWLGLVFAAIFLAAAVRLRRYREPI